MAKDKVTITLDRAKADLARNLAGAKSTSEAIDLALELLIASQQLRQDVEAYRRVPQTAQEQALADFAAPSGLADDVDWAALYADDA